MEIKKIAELKKSILSLQISELLNKELREELTELKIILEDILGMLKPNYKPLYLGN